MKCRICDNNEGNSRYRVPEMHYGTGELFDYVLCSRCDCLQIESVPEEMGRYYPDDLYVSMWLDETRYRGVRGFFRNLQSRLSLAVTSPIGRLLSLVIALQKNLASLSGLGIGVETRLLDVGCGKGKNLLYPLRQLGFRWLAGCDPYLAGDLSYGNGLRIMKCRVEELPGRDEWDMVTFHHSFEHMANPAEVLAAAFRLLRPGGRCLIRIPTVSSSAWERYGVHWVQLDAPRHLFLHSVRSMTLLAGAAGFVLEKITYDSNHFQFSASEGYLRGIPLKDQGRERGRGAGRLRWYLRRALLNRKAYRLNREGRGDQAAFLLKKPES